jgi:hypothetical protein
MASLAKELLEPDPANAWRMKQRQALVKRILVVGQGALLRLLLFHQQVVCV